MQHSMPYARDMDANLTGKFIGMYVNNYTRDYGEVGREAIRRFLGGGAGPRLRRSPSLDRLRNVNLCPPLFFLGTRRRRSFGFAHHVHAKFLHPLGLLFKAVGKIMCAAQPKSTTNEKVKKMNRTSQNSPRIRNIGATLKQ